MERIVRYVLTGDNRSAVRAMEGVAKEGEKTEKQLKHTGEESERAMGKVESGARRARNGLSLLAGAAGLGGLAFGIKDSVEAATQFQAQQAQLRSALQRNLGPHRQTAQALREINEATEESSLHGGFKGKDQTAALSLFVTKTHDVTKALKLNSLATDIARRTGMQYTAAQKAVLGVQDGTIGRLQKYIGTVRPVTKNVDALTAAQKRYYPEMVKQAQALDRQATAQRANAALSKAFGGASAAYSKTAAGAIQNLQHAVETLAEKIGVVLLPYVTKAAVALTSGFDLALQKWPQIKAQIDKVIDSVKVAVGWFRAHRDISKALITVIGVMVGAFAALEFIQFATAKATKAVAFAQSLYRAATIAATIATGGLEVAQVALAIAFASNPIGFVVTAIAGLTAAVVYCYFHFKTFRRIVQGVFHWLLNASKNVLGFFEHNWRAMAEPLEYPFKILYGAIKEIIKGIDYIISHANKVVGVAKSIGHPFGSAAHFLTHPHLNKGGVVPHFSTGGMVGGTGNTDTVPAWLTPGEVVLRKATVSALGGPAAANSLNTMSSGGGMRIESTPVTVMLDSRVLAEAVTHHVLKMAARR